jgi:hypothetical protein
MDARGADPAETAGTAVTADPCTTVAAGAEPALRLTTAVTVVPVCREPMGADPTLEAATAVTVAPEPPALTEATGADPSEMTAGALMTMLMI